MGHILRALEFESIAVASNGATAWQMLTTTPFDLIICDWQMPGMSGLQLLQRVRSSEEHRDLPFIMVTGVADRENVVAAVEAGVNNYIVKPFSRDSVLKALKETPLKRRSTSPPEAEQTPLA